MMQNEKITEREMLERFASGTVLIPPLTVRNYLQLDGPRDYVDARIELTLPDETEGFWFAVEAKSRSTPQSVQAAVARAKAAAKQGDRPMIYVPYLSQERLKELEHELVSGIDLCGNGVVIIPGKLYVARSGHPNRHPDRRTLNNPYRGRSAMVGRMLLSQPRWNSLNELTKAIQKRDATLSLGQASKAIHALQEDLIVAKDAGTILLRDPKRLLDKLGNGWKTQRTQAKQPLRLSSGLEGVRALSSNNLLRWVVAGESSVARYATFSQGGPMKVMVSSLPLAMTILNGSPEPIPSFAHIELIETDEPGFFFESESDGKGMHWASQLQTWLELQAGDARQKDSANDIRQHLLGRLK